MQNNHTINSFPIIQLATARGGVGRLSGSQVFPDQIKDRLIESLSVSKLNAGTIRAQMAVGGANVLIDGSQGTIIINDGFTDRILIGYGKGLF